jgi:hypothetical protein
MIVEKYFASIPPVSLATALKHNAATTPVIHPVKGIRQNGRHTQEDVVEHAARPYQVEVHIKVEKRRQYAKRQSHVVSSGNRVVRFVCL